MIRVRKKIFEKGNRSLGIPNGGGEFYMLNYRKGAKFFKEYPDRSQFTDSPFMKRCYQLDDQLEFFMVNNLGTFVMNRDAIVDDALEFVNELLNEAAKYPEGSSIHFIYKKRAYCIEAWVEELLTVKAKWPLEKSIKKLKSKRIKLK